MVLSPHASYPHERYYVLKLHSDASPPSGSDRRPARTRGFGTQFQFTSGEELLACLIRAAELQEQPGLEESES
jgi:hypothetical protein